jgi:Domain of unknown function (DUF4964)/Domain of unknown function (DUF5127)
MRLAAPLTIAICAVSGQGLAPMRPPAVPLVTHDPYFSVWSAADRLTGAGTTHWTGKPNGLYALVRVDGQTYRLTGDSNRRAAAQAAPALEQTSLEVLPTRTIYHFAGAGVTIGLTFFTPALPGDLEILSRPLTYIEWTINSNDAKDHDVSVYFEAAADLAVNTPGSASLAGAFSA